MSDPTIVAATPADEVDRYMFEEIRQAADEWAAGKIPVRFADAVATHPQVQDWVRGVVALAVQHRGHGLPAVRTGPSLLLVGPVGVGKTHQAWGAVRAVQHAGVHCRWAVTTAADLFAGMRPRDGVDTEGWFRGLCRSSLLVLDDLGATQGNPSREETLLRLIDHRYREELPTLITTNVASQPERPGQRREKLADVLGDRVASRLAQMCVTVWLGGPDRRRETT